MSKVFLMFDQARFLGEEVLQNDDFKIQLNPPLLVVPFGELTDAEKFGVYQYHSLADALLEKYPLQFPTQQRRQSKKLDLGSAVVMLTIEKLSEFAREDDNSRRVSTAVYTRGLPWKMFAVSRTDKVGQKCLDFFYQCNGEIIEVAWCCVNFAWFHQF
uniref:DBD_Tnp_Mut domain-containing protein n=1 Tax=Globodera pallida TaxID=36090 RepID=A0A183BNC7_GLOPA